MWRRLLIRFLITIRRLSLHNQNKNQVTAHFDNTHMQHTQKHTHNGFLSFNVEAVLWLLLCQQGTFHIFAGQCFCVQSKHPVSSTSQSAHTQTHLSNAQNLLAQFFFCYCCLLFAGFFYKFCKTYESVVIFAQIVVKRKEKNNPKFGHKLLLFKQNTHTHRCENKWGPQYFCSCLYHYTRRPEAG